MIYLGVDPGKGGGFAAVRDDGAVVRAWRMPETDHDVLEQLRQLRLYEADHSADVRAVLEFVRSSPQMGVTSAFTFGCGYGALRMALAAQKISYEETTPGVWQQALGCRSKGDKNVTKARAQQLFPDQKVTHAIGDALLLAEYCRRIHLGLAPRSTAQRARQVLTGAF